MSKKPHHASDEFKAQKNKYHKSTWKRRSSPSDPIPLIDSSHWIVTRQFKAAIDADTIVDMVQVRNGSVGPTHAFEWEYFNTKFELVNLLCDNPPKKPGGGS